MSYTPTSQLSALRENLTDVLEHHGTSPNIYMFVNEIFDMFNFSNDNVSDVQTDQPSHEEIEETEEINYVGNITNLEYYCHECGENCMNITGFYDHILIYHDNEFVDEYICDACGEIFSQELQLTTHYQNTHDNEEKKDEDEDDVITHQCSACHYKFESNESLASHFVAEHGTVPIDNPDDMSIYPYQCPFPECNVRFTSQEYLGEHYTYSHSGYNDQSTLDVKITHNGFCGFDVLEQIGMIQFLGNRELSQSVNKVCCICADTYKYDILQCNTLSVASTMRQSIINSVNTELYDDDEDEDVEVKYPIKMNCCGNIVCASCVIKTEKIKGLECLFCSRDHTLSEGCEYVKEIIPFRTNDTWTTWWSLNNKIDMLASSKHAL
jgi:hypothetical protein